MFIFNMAPTGNQKCFRQFESARTSGLLAVLRWNESMACLRSTVTALVIFKHVKVTLVSSIAISDSIA